MVLFERRPLLNCATQSPDKGFQMSLDFFIQCISVIQTQVSRGSSNSLLLCLGVLYKLLQYVHGFYLHDHATKMPKFGFSEELFVKIPLSSVTKGNENIRRCGEF